MKHDSHHSRRHFLRIASATALFPNMVMTARADSSGERSTKKGFCGSNVSGHKQINPAWYYNWTRGGKGSEYPIEFVPMVKGKINVVEKTFKAIRQQKNIHYLLGYNEPERERQGNISVEKGLLHWPKLVKLAKEKNLRLGSPAVSNDDAGNQWLDEFMKAAKRKKLHIDFLAVHWYSGTDVKEFKDWLDAMYKKYRLPIWVTEFNGWEGTHEEMEEFALGAFKVLEKHRRVERYAYFSKKKGEPGSLWNKDGSLSTIGLALKEI